MTEKEKFFKSVFDYIEINGFANFSLDELSKQKNINMPKIEKCLIKIYEQVTKNPRLLNLISKKIYNFIQTIFNLSGAKKNFILDKLSINSLFLIYLYVFNTWIRDNTSEMSKTMSDLDLCLSRAEMVMKKVN